MKVYGRKLCSECQKVKAFLEQEGIPFTYFDLATVNGLAEYSMDRAGEEDTLPAVVFEQESERKALDEEGILYTELKLYKG